MNAVIHAIQILGVVFLVLGVIAVALMMAIAVDEARWSRGLRAEADAKTAREVEKAELRTQKEREARQGNFFASSNYVPGFDDTGELLYRGEHRYPTKEAQNYAETMNAIADTQNIKVFTEEV